MNVCLCVVFDVTTDRITFVLLWCWAAKGGTMAAVNICNVSRFGQHDDYFKRVSTDRLKFIIIVFDWTSFDFCGLR